MTQKVNDMVPKIHPPWGFMVDTLCGIEGSIILVAAYQDDTEGRYGAKIYPSWGFMVHPFAFSTPR
jgi:hypothetical protein